MNRKALCALLLLLPWLVVSCKPAPKHVAKPSPETKASSALIVTEGVKLDIGDVDSQVYLEAKLAPESQADNVVVDEMSNIVTKIQATTITVSPPHPKELWLVYKIRMENRANFRRAPAVLRAKILAGGRELGGVAAVCDEKVRPGTDETKVNVLKDLGDKPLPETVLVTVTAEGLLMPEGADPDKIDPLTATASAEDRSSAIYYNPVRINFVNTPPKPTASPPAGGAPAPATGAAPAAGGAAAAQAAPVPSAK